MALEVYIRGKIDGIAERKIDGLDITVLSIITKDGHLNTIYSDGHNLGYFIRREVEVWRKKLYALCFLRRIQTLFFNFLSFFLWLNIAKRPTSNPRFSPIKGLFFKPSIVLLYGSSLEVTP